MRKCPNKVFYVNFLSLSKSRFWPFKGVTLKKWLNLTSMVFCDKMVKNWNFHRITKMAPKIFLSDLFGFWSIFCPRNVFTDEIQEFQFLTYFHKEIPYRSKFSKIWKRPKSRFWGVHKMNVKSFLSNFVQHMDRSRSNLLLFWENVQTKYSTLIFWASRNRDFGLSRGLPWKSG